MTPGHIFNVNSLKCTSKCHFFQKDSQDISAGIGIFFKSYGVFPQVDVKASEVKLDIAVTNRVQRSLMESNMLSSKLIRKNRSWRESDQGFEPRYPT